MNTDEKIAAIEEMIVAMRWARQYPGHPEHKQLEALKEVAAELRARKPELHGSTRHEIGALVALAVRQPEADGRYRDSYLVGIGQRVIGRWRVIEFALERCEKETVA